jgi:hypothetical protein
MVFMVATLDGGTATKFKPENGKKMAKVGKLAYRPLTKTAIVITSRAATFSCHVTPGLGG